MDTIFKIPSADWSTENGIFTNHSITQDKVKAWNTQLQTGVKAVNSRGQPITLPVCPYDIQNLQNSASYLLNSVSKKFRIKILNSVGLQV